VTADARPGDLVLNPMCGIGTTLVEAVHAGRDPIGVEYESGPQARALGTPVHLIAHEDLLVLAKD
jgi:hypothetical protein